MEREDDETKGADLEEEEPGSEDQGAEDGEGDDDGAEQAKSVKKKRRKKLMRLIDNEVEVSEDEEVSADEELSEDDDIIDNDLIDDGDFDDMGEGGRKRKKKKNKRSRIEALADDDYALIEENTGRKISRNIDEDVLDNDEEDDEDEPRKRKRLKKKRVEEADSLVIEDGADAAERLEKSLFGDDDDGDDDDNMAENDNILAADDELDDDRDKLLEREYEEEQQMENANRVFRLFGEDLKDIFGDGEDYDEDLEEKQEDSEEQSDDEGAQAEKTQEQLEDEVLKMDIPERLQKRVTRRIALAPEEVEAAIGTEAIWIYTNAFASSCGKRPPDQHKAAWLPAIQKVLTYIVGEEHLEVPFILLYRKDYLYCQYGEEEPLPLEEAVLWQIDQWDDKWVCLEKRRARLLRMADELLPEDTTLRAFVEMARDEVQLDDVQDFLKTTQVLQGREVEGEEGAKSSIKRADGRAMKAIARLSSLGLGEFVSVFGISSRQLGDNLSKNYREHSAKDPEDDVDAVAADYISGRLGTVDAVKKAARSLATQQILGDVFVRENIRQIFVKRAVVSTFPTPKGVREVGWNHPMFEVRRIVQKPVAAFNDTLFLKINQAQKEGFITYHVFMPDPAEAQDVAPDKAGVHPFMDEFADFYLAKTYSNWDTQLTMIAESALRLLDRMATKYLEAKLLKEASDRVVEETAAEFDKLLYNSRYTGPSNQDDNQRTKIVACCAGNEEEASIFVLLNELGEVIEFMQFDFIKSRVSASSNTEGGRSLYLRKKKNIKDLQEWIKTHEPSLLLLDCSSLQSLDFKRDLSAQALFEFPQLRVEFANAKIGAIFAQSERAEREFKDYHPLLRQAIAMGRYVLDPISEMAALWYQDDECRKNKLVEREVLHIALHPQQKLVHAGALLAGLERSLVRAVNYSGVDLNEIVNRPHLRPTLQFVAGLGPVKAKKLLDTVKRSGYHPNRMSLMDEHIGIFGPCTFKNCAGFLKIRRNHAMEEHQIKVSPLDETRIHPESYALAQSVITDALEKEVSDDEEEESEQERKEREQDRMTDLISELREDLDKLEELDLDAFAELEEKDGKGKKREELYMIKAELKLPYRDFEPRFEKYQPINGSKLFELLSGENEWSLRQSQIVTVKVQQIRHHGVNVQLGSGLRGYIRFEDVSEDFAMDGQVDRDQREERLAERLHPGMTLMARVVRIDKDGLKVELACKSSMLDPRNDEDYSRKFEEVRPDIPQEHYEYMYRGMHPDDLQVLKAKKQQKASFIPRSIDHYLFKNMSRDEAVEALQKEPQGAMLIRPSVKGTNHLSITWKVLPDDDCEMFNDVDVLLENQGGMPTGLGTTLKVAGQAFEDLDEIVCRFVEPMVSFSNDMIAYKHFRFGNPAEINEMLVADLQSKRLPYNISADLKAPGRYAFSYIQNAKSKNVHKESIKLTPEGYLFKGKMYTSPEKLTDGLKRHIMKRAKQAKQQQSRQRHSGHPGPPQRHHGYPAPGPPPGPPPGAPQGYSPYQSHPHQNQHHQQHPPQFKQQSQQQWGR